MSQHVGQPATPSEIRASYAVLSRSVAEKVEVFVACSAVVVQDGLDLPAVTAGDADFPNSDRIERFGHRRRLILALPGVRMTDERGPVVRLSLTVDGRGLLSGENYRAAGIEQLPQKLSGRGRPGERWGTTTRS